MDLYDEDGDLRITGAYDSIGYRDHRGRDWVLASDYDKLLLLYQLTVSRSGGIAPSADMVVTGTAPEVWVTEFRCDGGIWKINECFLSERIARATIEDSSEWTRNNLKSKWDYRVRRYVPEPPPIPQESENGNI